MKKLIAVHSVQMAVAGKLAEILAGGPLVLTDAAQIEALLAAKAVREPTSDELEKLFSNDTVHSDGKPIGIADISKLTKDELIGLAAEKGITVDPKATKPELIAAIEPQSDLDEQL